MLQLWDGADAFARVEEWLCARGFFRPGGERLVADLFLSYGLSQAIRRETSPAPPEPCRLPVAACVVRTDNYDGRDACPDDSRLVGLQRDDAISSAVPLAVGDWRRSWSELEYRAAIERVRDAIEEGDVYQVNLVQHLQAAFDDDPLSLAARLRPLTQSRHQPFTDDGWRVLRGDGWSVVSASPELFLARRGDRVWTMPIKGTRPAGARDELHASTKDAAEHTMIVDLERNDLSRVCRPGTVRWPELRLPRRLAGVEHLVSRVEGRLRPGVGLAELLAATFPGGSVTGAPKIAAVDLIAALEPVGRGASMGALGTIRGTGDFELALTIRTFAVAEGRLHLWVGGGIVWDSDADAEVAESWVKAEPLLDALGATLSVEAQ